LGQQILAFIQAQSGAVSFAALRRGFGEQFRGDLAMVSPANPEIVWWVGMRHEFIHALAGLLVEEALTVSPTSPLLYLTDGAVLDLPLAHKNGRHTGPRWLPVVFAPLARA
jgi:hypothetical protein